MKIKELLLIVTVVSHMYLTFGWNLNLFPPTGTGMLTCFAVIPFPSLSLDPAVDDLKPLNYTISRIKTGIDAGKAILDLVGAKEYSTFFSKIGEISKHIAPFLGAIGPIFGFLDFFLPKGPSPELQYMIKEFAEINDRFDQVFADIHDVKALIIKEAVKEQYGKYQGEVIALSDLLAQVIDAKAKNLSSEIVEERKQVFLDEYERNAIYTATDILYTGMIEGKDLLIDIPKSVREYTDDDRLRTQNMMKGVLNVILKGVKVMLAYYQLKGDVIGYQERQKEWTEKIRQITSHMQAVDQEILDRWTDQLKLDVRKILTKMHGSSNNDLADHLYSVLTSKYDWRDWYVVVYNDVSGSEVRIDTNFLTFKWLGEQGRNVIITSTLKTDDSPSEINYGYVKSKIEQIPTGRWVTENILWGHHTFYEYYNAVELYNYMKEKLHNDYCHFFYKDIGSGVIKRSANPQYRAPGGRYVLIDRADYKFHVFGHCVVPASFFASIDDLHDEILDEE